LVTPSGATAAHGSTPRGLENRRDVHIQLIRETNERSQGEVLHSQLDALEVVRRHAELLCELLLSHSEVGTKLGELSTDILDEPVGVLLAHPPTLRPSRYSKHCSV
jgi:hypothetical protein